MRSQAEQDTNLLLIKYRKTMLRIRLIRWGMVFLFVLLGPAIATWFWSGESMRQEPLAGNSAADSRIQITLTGAGAQRCIPMEEYLYGSLPSVIEADYEMETLKAQAILLRTSLIGYYMEQIQSGNSILEEPKENYLAGMQLKELWGVNYYENSEKIRQAVDDTRGIYITYEGLPIKCSYFRISAGRTRDGYETLGQSLPYLKSVACSKDYLADGYLTHYSMKKKELERILGGEVKEFLYDSSGYCHQAVIQVTEETGAIIRKEISGEGFRELLGLSSAAFIMEQDGSTLQFTVKGVGHGLGFGQFAANQLALQGYDYNAILSYFFQNIALDKYE